MNKTKKTLISVAAVIVALVVICTAYLTSYSKANITSSAFMAINYGENYIRPHRLENQIVLAPEEAKAGLIFYPGGKVEADAYIPLMMACAQQDIFCVIAEMPFYLAVFDKDAAGNIINEYPEIESWYIAGHSLGGSMAASYAAENADSLDGIILLGAYSTADLSDTELEALSIYGSVDGVMNKKNYNKYKTNLPENYSEYVIEGGNHAFYGVYGTQRGDGKATVTNEEQIKITAQKIIEFINK